MAAPVAGQILSEVLPYLEVKKLEDNKLQEIQMPKVVGGTLKDAKEILKDFKIEIVENSSNSNDALVVKQIPEESVNIEIGKKVILYCE